jgi:hypothetical protein
MAYDRRGFLRASGTTIALPFMASLNHKAFAKEVTPKPIRRMIFLSFGWGVTRETWYPKWAETGADYTLPEGLQPLAKHRRDFSVIQGMSHQYSTEAHWGSTFYLTGANRYGVPGKSMSNTISADQIAAKRWGDDVRFASLQFDCDNASASGHGPGLSLAWDEQGKPLPGLKDPFLAYNRMFGDAGMSVDEKRAQIRAKNSSLDAIVSDAKFLKKGLNSADRDKLEEYLDSVRDIEIQLAREEAWMDVPKPKAPMKEPKEGLVGYEEIKLAYDLMVAALQTDSTRVITYRQPVDTLLKSLDVTITPHNMSHYSKGSRFEVSKLRDQKQSELLSYLFDRLKSTKDLNGHTLFDWTTISYGSNIHSIHNLNNTPALIAGNRSGLKLGEHMVMPKGTPLCNLWLTLLHANGLEQEQFGDSSGLIDGILA